MLQAPSWSPGRRDSVTWPVMHIDSATSPVSMTTSSPSFWRNESTSDSRVVLIRFARTHCLGWLLLARRNDGTSVRSCQSASSQRRVIQRGKAEYTRQPLAVGWVAVDEWLVKDGPASATLLGCHSTKPFDKRNRFLKGEAPRDAAQEAVQEAFPLGFSDFVCNAHGFVDGCVRRGYRGEIKAEPRRPEQASTTRFRPVHGLLSSMLPRRRRVTRSF